MSVGYNDPGEEDGVCEVEDGEEIRDLMENHDLDKEQAELVKEVMDELGVDEDDAVELEELL